MKRALIIFNPTAGMSTKQDILSKVDEKLKSLGYLSTVFILDGEYENNIVGYDFSDTALVAAIGGDGTVKVAARTIIQNKIKAPLAIIPYGSANVVAATLGLPQNSKDALKLLDEIKTSCIDVGLVNNKYYFLVGFSVGYVSHIVISTGKELKNKFGHLGYLIRLFFNKIRIARIKFRIDTRNKSFWVKGNSLIVFNAFNYFGFRPKKEISMTDGIFNLYVVTNKTFWTMFEAALGVLFYTNPTRHIFALDDKKFKITLIKKRKYLKTCQIDGDRISISGPIEIEVLPQAIEIITKNNA